MFKVPDWEEDFPRSDVNFGKKINHKHKVPTNTLPEIKGNQNDNNKEHMNGMNKVLAKENKNDRRVNITYKKKIIKTDPNSKAPNSNTYIHNTNLVNGITKPKSNNPKHIGKITKTINKKKLESAHNLQVSNCEKVMHKTTLVNGINKTQSKKRKHDDEIVNKKKKKELDPDNNLEMPNFASDLLDEVIINVKKKKLNDAFKNDDREDVLFSDNNKISETTSSSEKPNKVDIVASDSRTKKKERIKDLLQKQSNRSSINISGNKLRQRMLERLKAAQFRYINEKLYTSSGSEAQKLFQSDPVAFQTYHQGYQQQVKKWPVNPLDVIVKRIQKMPKSHIIADMGCGEAALSKRVPQSVRSFDLVAGAGAGVEACDMARTPLPAAGAHAAVYCLALMGTDLTRYLLEANRVLTMGGHLLIAEVESRFDKVENFTKDVERLGFKLKNLDKTNKVFFFMEFTKIRDSPVKKAKLPTLSLKPCLYKKR